MNSSSATYSNNSTTIIAEPWFVPVDIIVIVCLVLTIILAILFLSIIISDKTCHTVPMLLTVNICFTGLICAIAHLSLTTFTLYNDLRQSQDENTFCYTIGYLSYATCAAHSYSYVSSAIHRYLIVVYPARVLWRSLRIQLLLIGLGWFLAYTLPIGIAAPGSIIYNVYNQICQAPVGFSFPILYAPLFIYIIPVHLVIFIYMKLVRYVREMSRNITPTNTLARAQRDLSMVRRIVILIHILLISGFPLSLFIFLSFTNRAPKYHFRIGFIFVEASLLFVMIALFQFTDSLKASVKKRVHARTNIVPTVA